ncbi:MAG: aminopeptidase [Clostridium sp.]
MKYISSIKSWKAPLGIDKEIGLFLNKTYKLLLDRINFYESFNDRYFLDSTFEELKKDNQNFYLELNEHYTESYANPHVTKSKLPDTIADLASSLYYEVINSIQYIIQGKDIHFEKVIKKFLILSNAIDQRQDLYQVMESFEKEYFIEDYRLEIESMYQNRNFATKFLEKQDLSDLRYLFSYGINISETEIEFAKLIQSFDQNQIHDLAAQMTYGYLKGFERHNKKMGNRDQARIVLIVGLEKIAKEIQKILKKEGYNGFVGDLVYTKSLSQAVTDYNKVKEIALEEEFYELSLEAYKQVLEEKKDDLYAYQGNIIMVCFGQKNRKLIDYEPIHPLLYEVKKNFDLKKRTIFELYVPKSEISYTGMAFPVKDINPSNYSKIFSDVMKINKMPAEEHERMQDDLIDVLDQGEYVELKGFKGNETDIKVYLHELTDPNKQTNFVNCGSDVNIPVGEVYTSPKLKGTCGIIHLKQIRIAKIQFKDVRIKVENGFAVEYSCKNSDNDIENHRIMEEIIFHHRDKLPLGEFALGTNTYAYKIAKKDGILHLLHTLIYEKLGPHIALGDTCFAWAEDTPLYGKDNKLVVAKDNEFSIKRKENPTEAYVNLHYDLTIPYDEIGLINVHTRDGRNIEIVKNGMFTLKGLESLNEFLG